MIMESCQCGMIPTAHDHIFSRNAEGKYAPHYDMSRIGHVWVNWKEYARLVSLDLVEPD